MRAPVIAMPISAETPNTIRATSTEIGTFAVRR